MMSKVNFNRLWSSSPDHVKFPTLKDLYSELGGAQKIGISSGSRIIFRVSDFWTYLIKTLGQPTVDNISPYDDNFKGRKGIVAFSVNWQGATGHIALWNGSSYKEPSYDNYSTYINATYPSVETSRDEFWEIS